MIVLLEILEVLKRLIPLINSMAYIIQSMTVKQRKIWNGTENKHDYTKQTMKYIYIVI